MSVVSLDRQRAESYIRENRWLPTSEWAHPDAKRPAPATVLPCYLRKRKIRGLPEKWRPMYDELARRMYRREPGALEFAYEADRGVFIVRPFDFVGPRDEGWLEFHDPNDLAAYLGIADALAARKRARRAPTKKAAPKKAAPEKADPAPGELPQWATEYLARLVYAAKRDYAAAWLAHVLHGAPEPADPGRDWARKVRDRVERLRKLNG